VNVLLKKSVAECFGTFTLVFVACGVAIVTGAGAANALPTALAFGLVILAMVYCIGPISGCHINPAVSVAMLCNKKMSWSEFGCYIAAQFVGATLGAAALYGIVLGTGIYNVGATNTVVSVAGVAEYSVSMLLEIILTFLFVYTILCVTSKPSSSKKAGFVIGMTLTLVHLLGIGITGTSVNPARSFGPALMTWAFGGGTVPLEHLWVFIAAPILGALLAACVFKCLNKEEETPVLTNADN